MGFALSWFAVRGKTPELVLEAFGLARAGKAPGKAKYWGGNLPGGWFLVVRERHEFTDDELRRLSAGCEVIACYVEEHVMFSCAAAWKDRKQVWKVSHSSEEGIENLEVEGTPPAALAGIRDRLRKEQKEDESGEVDFIFQIPVDLAKEVTGFSHEATSGDEFESLVRPGFLGTAFWGGLGVIFLRKRKCPTLDYWWWLLATRGVWVNGVLAG